MLTKLKNNIFGYIDSPKKVTILAVIMLASLSAFYQIYNIFLESDNALDCQEIKFNIDNLFKCQGNNCLSFQEDVNNCSLLFYSQDKDILMKTLDDYSENCGMYHPNCKS